MFKENYSQEVKFIVGNVISLENRSKGARDLNTP